MASSRGYSMREKKDIVNRIIEEDAYSLLKGTTFWKKYAGDRAKTTRTWQSLKETFIKRILPDLKNPYYGLSSDTLEKFKNGQRTGYKAMSWAIADSEVEEIDDTSGRETPNVSVNDKTENRKIENLEKNGKRRRNSSTASSLHSKSSPSKTCNSLRIESDDESTFEPEPSTSRARVKVIKTNNNIVLETSGSEYESDSPDVESDGKPVFVTYKGKVYPVYENVRGNLKRKYYDPRSRECSPKKDIKIRKTVTDDSFLASPVVSLCCQSVQIQYYKDIIRYLSCDRKGRRPSLNDYKNTDTIFSYEHSKDCKFSTIKQMNSPNINKKPLYLTYDFPNDKLELQYYKDVQEYYESGQIGPKPIKESYQKALTEEEKRVHKRYAHLYNNEKKRFKYIDEEEQDKTPKRLILFDEEPKTRKSDTKRNSNSSEQDWKTLYLKEKEERERLIQLIDKKKSTTILSDEDCKAAKNSDNVILINDDQHKSAEIPNNTVTLSVSRHGQKLVNSATVNLNTQATDKLVDLLTNNNKKIEENEIQVISSNESITVTQLEESIFDEIKAIAKEDEELDSERSLFSVSNEQIETIKTSTQEKSEIEEIHPQQKPNDEIPSSLELKKKKSPRKITNEEAEKRTTRSQVTKPDIMKTNVQKTEKKKLNTSTGESPKTKEKVYKRIKTTEKSTEPPRSNRLTRKSKSAMSMELQNVKNSEENPAESGANQLQNVESAESNKVTTVESPPVSDSYFADVKFKLSNETKKTLLTKDITETIALDEDKQKEILPSSNNSNVQKYIPYGIGMNPHDEDTIPVDNNQFEKLPPNTYMKLESNPGFEETYYVSSSSAELQEDSSTGYSLHNSVASTKESETNKVYKPYSQSSLVRGHLNSQRSEKEEKIPKVGFRELFPVSLSDLMSEEES